MSDSSTQKQDATSVDRRPRTRTSAAVMILLSLCLLIGVVMGSVGYFRSRYSHIATRQQQLMQQLQELHAGWVQKDAQIAALQTRLSALQSEQAHRPVRWVRAEVHYLVWLADYTLRVTHQISTARTLLHMAREKIMTLRSPEWLKRQKILDQAIIALQSYAARLSKHHMIARLETLAEQIHQLPYPHPPIVRTKAISSPQHTEGAWWAQIRAWLSRAFVVHYDKSKDPTGFEPHQWRMIRQALPVQLTQAEWAVLHGDQTIYQWALKRARTWIQRVYDPRVASVQAILSELQTLEARVIQPPALPQLRDFLHISG